MLKLVDHLYHLGKEVQLSMKVETQKTETENPLQEPEQSGIGSSGDFETSMISVLRALVRKMYNMHKHGDFSREGDSGNASENQQRCRMPSGHMEGKKKM
jgi:hypothetical protein